MNDNEKISQLLEMIQSTERICVFTGAGISVPSGIPDFRSANGIYNEKTNSTYTPEQIISHSVFVRETELFYEFYRDKMLYPDAKPNDAHIYFAELEKQGKKVSVVTQNIDGLHQAAGSSEVIELHGSVHRNYCMNCRAFYDMEFVKNCTGVPRCKCGGIVKPDVVLYEEPLDETSTLKAIERISEAETLIIIGTSLIVYPAASYVRYFRGKNLVLINKSSTPYDSNADLAIYDDVVNVVHGLSKLTK
ncbi:MAG: NAD-dependent protein deacylase [Ruminiclostridium sp.]|nr:NAD-dependent protein deacylase [Ruminiclostridium sp.]